MSQSKVLAAGVLIPNNKGEFLSVSRKNMAGMWGIPGGKLDFLESMEEAAIRETLEETNLDVSSGLQLLYNGLEDKVYMWTYLYTDYKDYMQGLIITEPGIYFDWLTEEELSSHYMSPFWHYNRRMFNAYEFYRGCLEC
jgi:8-oxo-dGTP pyrophosphatase MutT (NUDIX family)